MSKKHSFLGYLIRPPYFFVAAAVLCGFVIVIAIQSFKATEQTVYSEFNQRQRVLAEQTARGIQSHIETLVISMRTMSETPGIATFNAAKVRPLVNNEFHLLKSLGVNDVGVIDANGILRVAAQALDLEGADFSWRKYFKLAKHRAAAGKPMNGYCLEFIEFKGVEAGKKGILLCIAIRNPESASQSIAHSAGQTFLGVVVCTFKLDTLTEKFIAPLKSAEYSHALLWSGRGEVLWSPDRSLFGKNIIKERAACPFFNNASSLGRNGENFLGELDCYRYLNHANGYAHKREPHLIAAVPVALGEQIWSLGLFAPTVEARRLVRSVFVKQLALSALVVAALLLAISFALFVSNRYNRRLEKDVALKTMDLAESHRRFLLVLDSLDAYVIAIDMKTFEILFANKALHETFGDVVGKPCWQVLQTGQTGQCEFCPNARLLTPDGRSTGVHSWEIQNTRTQQWWAAQGRALRWIDDRMVTLEVAVDITESKLAQIELKRSHQEMGTFCGIIKEIGTMESLDSIGAFLLKKLGAILDRHNMALLIFNKYRDILYVLTDGDTRILKEHAITAQAAAALENLNGVTISTEPVFKPPVIQENIAVGGKQTIIPLQVSGNADGALVLGSEPDRPFAEKELDLIELILEQVSGVIKRAVRHREDIRSLQDQIENTFEYCGIVGKAPEMQVIYKLINDIAPTDATVLIQGESGTGKELVARAIHRQSMRRNKPFVVINCAAYPTTLLESELFGHEKGAFTGATKQKVGRFEQADGGTVFLDEIGEVPLSAQIKLLRVLQTQRFERLGGTQTLEVDVRILSATNKDLLEEVKKGSFREDLYYRLNVIPITLPPLRNRRNDIPLLIEHFQHMFAAKQGQDTRGISSQALRRFLDYHWPGNVRELENSIEHAVILSKGGRIEVSSLPMMLAECSAAQDKYPAQGTLMEVEKKILIKALEEQNWNKSKAALQLSISRSALYDKLRKYNITKPDD